MKAYHSIYESGDEYAKVYKIKHAKYPRDFLQYIADKHWTKPENLLMKIAEGACPRIPPSVYGDETLPCQERIYRIVMPLVKNRRDAQDLCGEVTFSPQLVDIVDRWESIDSRIRDLQRKNDSTGWNDNTISMLTGIAGELNDEMYDMLYRQWADRRKKLGLI